MRVIHSAGPFAHSLIDRVFEHLRSALHRMHLRAQQLHAVNIEPLPLTVQLPHKNFAFHTQKRRHCRSRNAVLSRAGFRDHTRLTHFFGQKHLSDAVVDLVGSGMVEIFSLEIDLCSSEVLCHLLRIIKAGRPARVLVQELCQLCVKSGIILIKVVLLLQPDQLVHQCLRNILTAEFSKSASGHLYLLVEAPSLPAHLTAALIAGFTGRLLCRLLSPPARTLPSFPDPSIRPSPLHCSDPPRTA